MQLKCGAGCNRMTTEGIVDHADGTVGERGNVHLSHLDTRWGKAIVNIVSTEGAETPRMLPHAKETFKTQSMTTGHCAPDGAVEFLQAYRTLARLHLLFQTSP